MLQKTILFLFALAIISGCNSSIEIKTGSATSVEANPTKLLSNKKVVETYMEGFRQGDHAKILSCLTDSVVWEMTGLFRLVGKIAFDKEIENPAFEGRPAISVIRLVEEGDVVVAEGSVKCKIKNGGILNAMFCDVFHFENGRIKQLTGYLMQKNNVQKE